MCLVLCRALMAYLTPIMQTIINNRASNDIITVSTHLCFLFLLFVILDNVGDDTVGNRVGDSVGESMDVGGFVGNNIVGD
mmetsp:Transcript_75846/g.93136  ORF Transcript_75846/g.93136 Transcript_75846/m.93136 type:complete len:80 (-) Transcript_75846:138-377(-)